MPRKALNQKFVDSQVCRPNQRKLDYFDTTLPGLMLEVRISGRTYYLRYKDGRGKTRQKKLADARILKLSDARKLAQEALAMIAMGQDPFEAKRAMKETPTFGQFVAESYMPHVKGYKRSWNTDETLLRNHILPAIGHLYLDEVTRRDLINLFSRHRSSHKPASTNRIIILCRYIYNCAIKWETAGATKNPTLGIALYPENNKKERFITEKETKGLFVALDHSGNPQLKYIVAMLLLTGARKREVLDARWSEFDLERRIWTIQINKSGKPRHIPVSDGLLCLLNQIDRIKNSDWIFPNPRLMKPYRNICNSWNTARVEAGLPELRIHDLRHSFASFLINSGRSLYEVQKILGHTQVKTTQRYAHLTQESLISAADSVRHAVPLANLAEPEATLLSQSL